MERCRYLATTLWQISPHILLLYIAAHRTLNLNCFRWAAVGEARCCLFLLLGLIRVLARAGIPGRVVVRKTLGSSLTQHGPRARTGFDFVAGRSVLIREFPC